MFNIGRKPVFSTFLGILGVSLLRLVVLDCFADDGGVETAEEATEPAEPNIDELCRDMFDKMAVFLQGELTGTLALSNYMVRMPFEEGKYLN